MTRDHDISPPGSKTSAGSETVVGSDRTGQRPDKTSRKAIALHYSGKNAPKITASGRGLIADQIIEIARENQVPVHEDPALAAFLAQIPIGDEIPEDLYAAVAEVLAFIYLLSGRRPGEAVPGECVSAPQSSYAPSDDG